MRVETGGPGQETPESSLKREGSELKKSGKSSRKWRASGATRAPSARGLLWLTDCDNRCILEND